MQKKWRQWLKWGQKNWLTMAIWTSVLLVSSWICLTKPMFYTHDYLHGVRIAQMAKGLLEGQFPVLWSQDFGFGYGMPRVEFYAPLPYFVGAIFYLISGDLLLSVKGLYILLNVLTMWGMYTWARYFFDRPTSALAGGMLTLASYRAVDIFVRGAMSEAWAIMALPWLLAGITGILRGEKKGMVMAFWGGITLCLSHNITTMLAAPLLLLYILLYIIVYGKEELKQKKFAIKVVKMLVGTGLAVVGASCFYLVPAFFEKGETQIEQWILSDYFDYHNHFLYIRQFFRDQFDYGGSGWGDQDGMSFFLGWAQWLGWLVAIVAGGCYGYRECKKKKVKWLHLDKNCTNVYFFAGVSVIILIALFMTLLKSTWCWEMLAGLLAFSQFPWRFLGVAIVFLALVAVAGTLWLPKKWQLSAVTALWLLLLMTSAHYFQGDSYLDEPAFYRDDNGYIRTESSYTLVDYLPKTAANFNEQGNNWEAVDESIKIVNRQQQPNVMVERMHEKLYGIESEQAGDVELAIHNYPGWSAEINGQKVPIDTSERGNITVHVPRGQINLGLKLKQTPLRFWSNWVSTLTWAIISYLMVFNQWQKKTH
ncbi:hypothetical protein IJI99_01790 [bacterium]|nr:hypothetical protein [bacterium]